MALQKWLLKTQYISLLIIAASLSFSKFALSVGIIAYCISGIFTTSYAKGKRLKKDVKSLLLFQLFYVFLVISLFWSRDLGYGLHDLQIKLPVLILPAMVFLSPKLNLKKYYTTLYVFIASVTLSTFIGFFHYMGWFSEGINPSNPREISVFISHIRFALMICLSFFVLIHSIFDEKNNIKWLIVKILLSLWLVFFLFILKNLTSFVILIVLTIIYIFIKAIKSKNMIPRYFLVVINLVIIALTAGFVTHYIKKFYTVDIVEIKSLDKETLNGRNYLHYTDNKETENGHYLWLYFCPQELKTAWEERSKLVFEGQDLSGNNLKHTLIRYLTSKGLRKDSVGVMRLSNYDIQNIEKGIANYIYADGKGLWPLAHRIIWEFDRYKKSGHATGSSIVQRLVYVKAGLEILKNNWVYGVGVGDVQKSYGEEYASKDYQLSEKWKLRAHNQLLTIAVTGGIIGLFILMISFLYAPYLAEAYKNPHFLFFMGIALLSFLSEDTLETHIGASFFAFFFAFFVYAKANTKET